MLLIYLSAFVEEDEKDFFEKIYNAHRKQMLYVAFGVLHDSYEAENAVQDAFISLIRVISKLKSLETVDLKNYCLKTSKNAALQILRKKTNEVDIEEIYSLGDELSDDRFIEQLMLKEAYDKVVDSIVSLNEIYSSVLYGHFVLELSVDELSKTMNIKRSTVKQRLVRGKKLLIDIIGNSSCKEEIVK